MEKAKLIRVDKMPKEGQFLVVWKFNERVWSDVCKYDDQGYLRIYRECNEEEPWEPALADYDDFNSSYYILDDSSSNASKTIHYINLTNGLLAIKDYNLTDYRFIRIQSTWCEQKRWEDILMALSDDFLMNLALGNRCIVYDYGTKKKIPRAVWQGLSWISYVLRQRWYIPTPEDAYKLLKSQRGGASLYNYFQFIYTTLSDSCKSKIDYYKKYRRLSNGIFHLESVTDSTDFDNDIPYVELLTHGN